MSYYSDDVRYDRHTALFRQMLKGLTEEHAEMAVAWDRDVDPALLDADDCPRYYPPNETGDPHTVYIKAFEMSAIHYRWDPLGRRWALHTP